MRLREYLSQSAQEINEQLAVSVSRWEQEVSTLSPQLVPLLKTFFAACEGGKRIRSSLVKLGYELYKPSHETDIVTVGIAYELFQTAILAHDDIIDKSPKRRGKPSLYHSLGGKHLGISEALCLGDVGFFLTYTLLSKSRFPTEQKNQAVAFFSDAVYKTALGELLDVRLSSRTIPQSVEDILTVYRLKTAYYTVIAPLTIGAILGGANEHTRNAIARYGEGVGIAYQIQDDITDVFGESKQAQKELAGDIREGKNTLLFIYAQQAATEEQQDILARFYGNPHVSEEEIAEIRQVFHYTGALAKAQQQAQSYSLAAQKIVPEITQEKQLQSLLLEMTEFFLEKKTYDR